MQKRKCWEWEVAYERSHNTPEARAERERAAVQGGRYGRPWLNTPEARAERKAPSRLRLRVLAAAGAKGPNSLSVPDRERSERT